MAGKKKILLIDDDADFVDMNKAILEHQGYEVLSACEGSEGMTLARTEKPNLIILDVMMSSCTEGFHVAFDLKQNPDTKDIPIIMVSSVNETVPYQFGPNENWLPVDEFIEKPLDPKRLMAEVTKRIK